MQEKVYIIVVRYRQKFLSLGLRFGTTQQSLVMPNRDHRDGNFCLYLTAMKDTYNPSSGRVHGNSGRVFKKKIILIVFL